MQRSYGRTLGRLLVFDLQAAAPSTLIWWLAKLASPPTLALLMTLRLLAWFLLLWHFMAPIRRWEQTELSSLSNAALFELDAEVQAIPQRFTRAYALTWALSMGTLALLSIYGLPTGDIQFGPSEYGAALFLVLSVSVPVAFIFVSSTRHALAEPLFEISEAIIMRRLEPRRTMLRRERIGGQFVALLIVAYVLILSPLVLLWHGQGARAAARAQARELVLSAVVAMQRGQALPEGVERLRPASLDEPLSTALADAGGPDAMGVDSAALVVRGQAVARARLDDEQALLVRVDIDERVPELCLGLLVLLGLLSGVGWQAGRDLMRETLAPFEQFDETTRRFGESGELSSLERIVPIQYDEIGQLATRFNTMLDILEELSLAATLVADGYLNVRFTRPGQLHESFGLMVSRLAETVEQLRAVSRELAAVSSELEALTAQQELGALAQLEAVARVDTSVRALDTSGEIVSASAATVVSEATQSLLGVGEIAEQIAELRQVSEGISALIERVGEVAERSDLLALNGSLEAVRAGEVGRGFALVAAEMRRLAERAAHTLDDARARIAEVDAVGASTVAVAERGRVLAEATMAAAEEIAAETRARTREAATIVAGMREVSTSVRAGAQLTNQTRAAAAGLDARARTLELLLEGFAQQADEHH